MPTIRVSDSARNKDMWAAMGFALQASANATHAMLQLAATIAGSELVQFALQEGTLGAQVKSVTAMVARLNTNYWIMHPAVEAVDQEIAVRLLRSLGELVKYRNRVAHDVWTPYEVEGVESAIEGRRATRWSPVTVHSTIPSLNTLGFQFTTVAVGLGQVESTIEWKRAGKAGPATHHHDSASDADKLEAALRGMKDGTLQRWKWVEVKHDYTITR